MTDNIIDVASETAVENMGTVSEAVETAAEAVEAATDNPVAGFVATAGKVLVGLAIGTGVLYGAKRLICGKKQHYAELDLAGLVEVESTKK